MKIKSLARIRSVACLTAVVLSTSLGRTAGFPVGQLLVSSSSTVYLVDPVAGTSNIVATGLSGLKDVVYNPVTSSAFAVVGSDIIQITTTGTGYATAPFVSGISELQCLAVDGFGHVYFNEEGFVDHYLLRASLDGTVAMATLASFFVPEHMKFAKDFSKLFVFEIPDNDVKVVTFPSGTITTLSSGLDFPPGGDSDASGNVYVLEDFSTAKISRITPAGGKTTVASQPWMSFWDGDDLEYDDLSGTIYATSSSGLYALLPDLSSRKLFPGNGSFGGLSLIRPGLPLISRQPTNVVTSPGATAVFSVGVTGGGATSYQWRLNGTNLPGATGSSLTIANAGFRDAGAYSVLVVTAGGAAVSTDAALSLFALSIDPVVTLDGPVGARYRIDYRNGMESTNVWQVLTNLTAATNPYFVVDQAPASFQRFYRAVLLP